VPTLAVLSTGFSAQEKVRFRFARNFRTTHAATPLSLFMKSKPSLKRIKFGGLAAVELKTSGFRLVVITTKGPRIAFWGRPDGENLLMWEPGKYFRKEWELMGGHRVWVSRPGADEAQETYAPDNEPCEVQLSERGFTVKAPVDPVLLTQRGYTVTATGADRLEIEHFITNASNMLWSGAIWAITCTKPTATATYTVPLGDGSGWDYATIVAIRKWGDNQGRKTFYDPQFELTDDSLRLIPGGVESKRMIKADAGIIGMYSPEYKLAFVKQTDYLPDGQYPLGTNLALYVGKDNFMAEMETMGPFVTLKPGATTKQIERWVLRNAKSEPTPAELRELF